MIQYFPIVTGSLTVTGNMVATGVSHSLVGNVGIGTTSASYNLHTQTAGGTYNAVETLVTSSGAEATFLHKTPNGIALIALGANVSRGLSTATTNDWVFNNRAGGRILLSTDSTGTNAYMTMTSTGLVGIGTTNPSSIFAIDNSANANTTAITFTGYSSTSKGHIGHFSNNLYLSSNWYYSGAQTRDSNSYGSAAIVIGGGPVDSESFIDFSTATSSSSAPINRMRVTSGGQIGIGVTTPSSSLHINATDAIVLPVGTTAQRPSSVVNGMVRVNSDYKLPEWYDSNLSKWRSFGGDTIPVEYLVVAGGGGGGIDIGGGGGAGGYQAGTTTVASGTSYTVTVGAGGAISGSGSNSTFYSLVSLGGGGGGQYALNTAKAGGSGGGGGGNSQPAAAGTPGQGKDGGAGIFGGGAAAGGGGGGAGANGGAATYTSAGIGGNGGIGIANSITGSSVYYAGGGGGGQRNFVTSATGGNGGGGDGANINNQNGYNAVANTGGGGGGVGSGTTAGTGGSGIVVIKIPSTNTATFSSGLTATTITSVSGFNIYKVTAGTGTVTFS